METERANIKYNEAINGFANSLLTYSSPKEYKKIFARCMYLENGGVAFNPRMFGTSEYYGKMIAYSLEFVKRNTMDISQDVAISLDEKLQNLLPIGFRTLMKNKWGDVESFAFNMEDYEKWLKNFESKFRSKR